MSHESPSEEEKTSLHQKVIVLYKQQQKLYMHYMYSQGKNWVNLFLSFDEWEGHQRCSITPYIHCLVYHIPEMIRRYGNLRKFSCQGAHTCRVQGHTHTIIHCSFHRWLHFTKKIWHPICVFSSPVQVLRKIMMMLSEIIFLAIGGTQHHTS